MTMFHAVVFVDHTQAQVLQFDAEHVQAQKVKAHTHHTRQHGSGVRTEHEFFAELCATLEQGTQVLVTGGHTALADFRHYVTRHRPQAERHIAGYEVVDHPSDKQLLAEARSYFDRVERLAQPAERS